MGSKLLKELLFILPSIFVFLIYYSTMPRGLTGGDSGELLATLRNQAVPHPPVFVLLFLFEFFVTLTSYRFLAPI